MMTDINKIAGARYQTTKTGSIRVRNIHFRAAADRQDIQGIVRRQYASQWSNPLDSKPCYCGSDRPNGRSFCADCEADMRNAANA